MWSCHIGWNADRKLRSPPRHALNGDVTAHEPAKIPAERQAKTSPAILGRDHRGRLGKLGKESLLLQLTDADAGINDGKFEAIRAR